MQKRHCTCLSILQSFYFNTPFLKNKLFYLKLDNGKILPVDPEMKKKRGFSLHGLTDIMLKHVIFRWNQVTESAYPVRLLCQ